MKVHPTARFIAALALALSTVAQAALPPSAAQAVEDMYQKGLREFHLGHTAAAVLDFKAVLKADSESVMGYVMLSRCSMRLGKQADAFDESTAALKLLDQATPLEGYMANCWGWHMRSLQFPEEATGDQSKALWQVDYGIALYPKEPELFILRGDLAKVPVRGAPFYLAALKIQPDHPLSKVWKPVVPPLPKLDVGPGKTIGPPDKPIKLYDGLGHLTFTVTCKNPKAQAYFQQGLDCDYSYVGGAAEQSYRTAANLDPTCAMAYWGLSFVLTRKDPITPLDAAQHALFLAKKYGTDREQRYCSARVLQLQPNRAGKFLDALDGALMAYPNDPDLWVWRGKVNGPAGEAPDEERVSNDMPFLFIALMLQPDHPAANHELVHAFESIDRPILGWPYTWGYRRSAPHMPHAQHMQSHLAMHLGRWKEALACTRESVRLSQLGYPELDPSHHLNVLFYALGHEGHFKEAFATKPSPKQDMSWPRLLRLKLDLDTMSLWAQKRRTEANNSDGWYLGAIIDCQRGDLKAARDKQKKMGPSPWTWYGGNTFSWNNELTQRIASASGTNCVQGFMDIAKSYDSRPTAHRWGQGGYYDELWGEAALQAQDWHAAQEAFGEALAHDHGCIVGALGLQVAWEHATAPPAPTDPAQKKAYEAQLADFKRTQALMVKQYSDRAHESWSDADAGSLDRMLARLRDIANGKAALF